MLLTCRTLPQTRLLILNADPVFQDRAIALIDELPAIETRIVRTMTDVVSVLLGAAAAQQKLGWGPHYECPPARCCGAERAGFAE